MKKIISTIALAALLAVSCISCGRKDDSSKDNSTGGQGFSNQDILDTTDTEDTSNYVDNTSDQDDIDDSEDNREKYEQLADAIIANVDTLFTALKNGDIDTVSKYCLEDSDVIEDLLDCKDKAAVGEVMKVVFKDFEWTFTDECREELVDTLEFRASQGDDSEFGLDIYLVDHAHIYLEEFYFASLPEGTTLPEDYTGATEEEAKALLEKMIEVTPMECDESMFIEQINEDGSFKTDIDEILSIDMLPWDKIDRLDSSNVFRTFVQQILDVDSDFAANSTSSVFKEDNERMKQVETCLLNKDMVEYERLYNDIRGEAINSDVSYAELSKEQQDKLADIYANEVNVYRNSMTWIEKNEKYGSIIYTYPYSYFCDFDDEEAVKWLSDRNVVRIDINYDNISDSSEMLYVFGYAYGWLIDYVYEN